MDGDGVTDSHSGGWKGALKSYGVAAILSVLAFSFRWWLAPLLQDYSCFLLFAPAAILASWFFGVRSGLAAFTAGLFLGVYFFLEPIGSLRLNKMIDAVQVFSYAATTLTAIGLIESLRRSQTRAELAAEEARLRNAQLEKEVAERKRVQQALEAAKASLDAYSRGLEELVSRRTAKLEQTVSALEGFCYTIAHDLRAPLRAMQGFAQALLEDYGSALDPTGRNYAERISAAAQRMDHLIQDLLAYERLATLEVHSTAFPLQSLVDDVLTRLSPEIQTRGASISLDGPLPAVRCNPGLLKQALEHLLGNALKFTRPGVQPVIRISVETKENRVRLCIRDNGIGIEREYQARIFEPFTSLHGREAYSGNGIGLAFVQRAVDRMNGKVGVESSPGAGSQFWLELDLP